MDTSSEHMDQEREGDHHNHSINPHELIESMPITIAHKVSKKSAVDPNHESFHGCIRGPVAISRLKATTRDSYLVRYSENQKKYILTVLKRGLGQDEDDDLVKEFEIVECDNGKRCKVNGFDKSFTSLGDLLLFHECTPLHPSIAGIGRCCVSPRYRDSDRHELLASQISQAQATRMLTQLKTQDEEYKRRLDDMQAQLQLMEKEKKGCTIL